MRKVALTLVSVTFVFIFLSTKLSDVPPPLLSPKPLSESTINFTQNSNSVEQNNDKKPSSNEPKITQATNNSSERIASQDKTPKKQIVVDGKIYPNRVYQAMLVPNDPSSNQWWVAPNNMNAVWDIPAGIYETKVAVIDTGYALAHEEFAGRTAQNTGEIGITNFEGPSRLNCFDQGRAIDKSCNNIDDDFDQIVDNESGVTTYQNPSDRNCTDQGRTWDKSCNNLDDDANGFKDDVSGWDFVNYDSSVQAGETNPTGTGTTHGTMVAGILAANVNNGVGIAGVDQYTKILPIQALDDNGYGDSFTVGQAVYYATNQRADVISISLGTSADDPYLRGAIQYALDHGAIVVASAGNTSCDCISYPANYPEVVAVGAINSAGNLTTFSSYGAQLDLLAPGQSLTVPTYTVANKISAYATNIAGTSFSAPFVSGLLALGKMQQPTAAWEEIIGLMFENSDRRTNTALSPRTNTLGYGVARASTMLSRLTTPQTYVQRIQFDDIILGSQRNYQCNPDQIPATKLYELRKASDFKYTSNLRELSKAIAGGWTSREAAYVCMGLPIDTIQTLRILNLPSEISNAFSKN